MKEGLILRVGVDSNYGGFRSPRFSDGSYHLIHIPIPEGRKSKEHTYAELDKENQPFIPDKISRKKKKPKKNTTMQLHKDPEFSTPSYGQAWKGIPRSDMIINNLQRGSYLFFAAGFVTYYPEIKRYVQNRYQTEGNLPLNAIKNLEKKLRYNLCILGWMEVEAIYKLPQEIEKARKEMPENAHVKEYEAGSKVEVHLIKGNKSRYYRLQRIVPLTIPQFNQSNKKWQNSIREDLPSSIINQNGEKIGGAFERGGRLLGDGSDDLKQWLLKEEKQLKKGQKNGQEAKIKKKLERLVAELKRLE